MSEEKKEPKRLERLAYMDGFTSLAMATQMALDFEREQQGRFFAVGVVFVSTNGKLVYNMRWLRDKELLYEFIQNGQAINHAEVLGMAQNIVEYLNKEDGANIQLIDQSKGDK